MILKDFKEKFHSTLSELYPKTEIDSFFFLLIEKYLNFQKVDSILKADFKISDDKIILLENATFRLQQEEPIQYILEKTFFYGLPFIVNESVLIPRPETEELVEWILSSILESQKEKKKKLTILEIGTGSGCISIALKKHLPEATIVAIDISEKALKIARDNSRKNQVDVQFIHQDVLKPFELSLQFDIIVSNPPYVRECEKKTIKNNVLNNEPHIALFVEDHKPFLFYDEISDLANKYGNTGGYLFFEINQYLANETISLLKKKGLKNIELKKDFQGNDRMIKSQIGSFFDEKNNDS